MNSTTGPSSFVAGDITYADIDEILYYGVSICINYGTQIGASLILLIALVLVTRPEKRQSAVFIFNALSLAINFVRNILQCLYFTSTFWTSYVIFTGDYSNVPRSAYNTSIAGVLLTFLLVICLEISLVLQVRAVCGTMTDRVKYSIATISIAIVSTLIGFHFAETILNIKAINTAQSFSKYDWLGGAVIYLTTASICWFSVVFVGKLAFALVQRRKLGLTQFGPMQIIFIMGAQTLFIPAIMFIVISNLVSDSVPELVSQGLTIAVLFLPLSSIWASASIKGNNNGGSTFASMRANLLDKGQSSTSGSTSKASGSGGGRWHVSSFLSASQGRTSSSTDRNIDMADMTVHVDRSLEVSGDRV